MNYKKLYHFLMMHETGIIQRKKHIRMWVHVPYYELDKFIKIVKPEYENYPKAIMMESSVCVLLEDLLEGKEIKDYKDCFDKEDWQAAFDGQK